MTPNEYMDWMADSCARFASVPLRLYQPPGVQRC